MRYEQILAKDSFTKVDVAAVWPANVQIAPLPLAEIEAIVEAPAYVPTPAAPDVPASVGVMIIGSYVALLATFALATVASAHSIFMIAICAVFLVAYFTVPWMFFRQEPGQGERPSFGRFMREGLNINTGHSTGGAALAQMLIVPILLTFGVILMGIAHAIMM